MFEESRRSRERRFFCTRRNSYPLVLESVKAWFVSDIHISGPDDPRLKVFARFLRARLSDGTTDVFLVGDIFDLWVGSGHFFAKRYAEVVELVRQLRGQGVKVVYFEGNHDLHLDGIWARHLGCEVVTEPGYYQLGRWKVRVEHGDLMNPNDTGYLFLRRLLRTGFVRWLANALPGALIQGIGNLMSKSSRQWTSSSVKARDDRYIHSMIRSHAEKVHVSEEYFDLMISGHVHVRDDYQWESHSRVIRSVNLGWWSSRETPQAFRLEDSGGTWEEIQ